MISMANEKQTEAENRIRMRFPSRPENEPVARMLAASMMAPLDPTLDELDEVKTAVSEAVTNAIIHGYEQRSDGVVEMTCATRGRLLEITVTDFGKGISDLAQAREPMFSSRPEWERAGMGFTIMEHLMDEVSVHSRAGTGTSVTLLKKLIRPEMTGCH